MIPQRIAQAFRSLAVALAMASGGQAAVWVSPAGDDANSGTEEQPVRTLERARDLVRALNRDMADDITVFIAGEYDITRPIVFGPEDSGTNGFSIIYTAAPGEHPVISGGVRVDRWARSDAGHDLWSAPAPAGLEYARGLFVNGAPANRTRSRLLAVFSKAAEVSTTAPDPKAQWKNPNDVVFQAPAKGAIWSEGTAVSPTFVENAFELLGKPGEWYFDRPSRRIYYTPRRGEKMPTADVEAVVAGGLIVGAGSAEKPIAGLVFKGIRLEYTAGPEGTSTEAAAARFTHASGIQFLEDEFLHMGGEALSLGPSVEGGTVEGCLFGDISWSAVRLEDSSAIRITESRLSYTAVDHLPEGAIDVDRSGEIAIDHDQFDHFPIAAVAVVNSKAGSVRRASNWVAPPMLSLTGSSSHGLAAIPAQDIGISEDYRALEDEEFTSQTTPHPPTCVAAEAEDEFAYVTWIPSCRDGTLPVERYVVESSGGAKATVTADDFERKGYVVMEGLEDDRPVSFTVSAFNALGPGPSSLPTANVTPSQKRKLRPPGPPASVSVVSGGSGSTLQIRPPAADGGSPVVSYLVSAGPSAEPLVLEGLDVIDSDGSHPVSRTLPGFAPRAGTSVSVVAVNTAGEGKPAVVVLK